MIKKVGNWVFGSFFRTMGRFFFFLFFGFLLATILSKSEIKITDLLGIETVKADSYYQKWDQVWYDDVNLTQMLTPGTTFMYKSFTASTTYNSNLNIYEIYGSNKINIEPIKGGHLTIPFVIDSLEYTANNWSNFTLNNAVCKSFSPYTSGGYYCSDWEDTTTQGYNNPITYDTKVQMNVMVRYTSGYNDVCEIDFNTNFISCPIANANILDFDGLIIAIKAFNQGSQVSYRLGIGDKINGWSVDGKNVQDAIQSQTDTLTDTNTTEANTTASNFFSNFSDTDNGGISSIITAPLQAISGLVSATCTPITLPLPYLDNKTIVLPCMSAIYQEHFGAFFTIYQTIIFGALAYRMLVSIFMMIQGFKNPDDDKIEVVDL